jgi:hypothetical protein
MSAFIKAIGMGGGLLIAFVLLIFASGATIVAFPDRLAQFSFIVPVIFLFIAIGAFLLLLLHYAVTLHELKPDVPVSALGLPDGSIRAFLTIGLIALVAVFGTFIYFESGKGGYALVRADVPLTKPEQIEELKKTVGDRFLVIPRFDRNTQALIAADVVSATPDGARSDIAKQILTMIATVLTTVIGFYFGSRTTEQPTDGGAGGNGGGSGANGADARRQTALGEITTMTGGLEDRQKAADDLVGKARAVAAELRSAAGDPEGAAAAKVGRHATALTEAFTALRAAQKTAGDTTAGTDTVVAARDQAKTADTRATTAEAALRAFVEKKDPGAL